MSAPPPSGPAPVSQRVVYHKGKRNENWITTILLYVFGFILVVSLGTIILVTYLESRARNRPDEPEQRKTSRPPLTTAEGLKEWLRTYGYLVLVVLALVAFIGPFKNSLKNAVSTLANLQSIVNPGKEGPPTRAWVSSMYTKRINEFLAEAQKRPEILSTYGLESTADFNAVLTAIVPFFKGLHIKPMLGDKDPATKELSAKAFAIMAANANRELENKPDSLRQRLKKNLKLAKKIAEVHETNQTF